MKHQATNSPTTHRNKGSTCIGHIRCLGLGTVLVSDFVGLSLCLARRLTASPTKATTDPPPHCAYIRLIPLGVKAVIAHHKALHL